MISIWLNKSMHRVSFNIVIQNEMLIEFHKEKVSFIMYYINL